MGTAFRKTAKKKLGEKPRKITIKNSKIWTAIDPRNVLKYFLFNVFEHKYNNIIKWFQNTLQIFIL